MNVFFGTSGHSAKFLDLATQNGLKIDLVVSAPPKPVGRKKILTENPVVTLANELNLPVILKLNQLDQFAKLDLGIMLDFNRIIPQSVIDLFNQGIINIHFSKLPQYRGPAPVQYTILNGDKEAWITYYLINANLDEGMILKQSSLLLNGTETTGELYEELTAKAAIEIPEVLTDKVRPCQQEGEPTYTQKLTTEDTKIDWSKNPVEIDRLIRAASPEPGAWTIVELKSENSKLKASRLKILKSHMESNELVLDQVQIEGKNPVSWKQFKEGYPEAKILDF